jgi:hypothetical protein
LEDGLQGVRVDGASEVLGGPFDFEKKILCAPLRGHGAESHPAHGGILLDMKIGHGFNEILGVQRPRRRQGSQNLRESSDKDCKTPIIPVDERILVPDPGLN